MKYFIDWLNDRSGVTGMEYGVLAGSIAIAIIAAVFLSGQNVSTIFSTINSFMSRNI